jgi:hypothetical protein
VHRFTGEQWCAALLYSDTSEPVRCGRAESDGVHRAPEDADVTVVMQYPPVGEPRGKPVYDAPAEDGGSGGGFWSFDVDRLGLPVGKDGSAARAAWALRTGEVVGSGPWPVRQWFCPDGAAWERPGELIAALNVAGEPYRVEVWWADERTRLVRVTWGVALAWSDEETPAMVESWRV